MFPRIALVAAVTFVLGFGRDEPREKPVEAPPLAPPTLLRKEALEAGNPLATYAAMLDLEPQYRASKTFAEFYAESRFNFEEFLGFPMAGVQALGLPRYRPRAATREAPLPDGFHPESALAVVERQAQKTQIVIWAEEHHLPQTRSLFEGLLPRLWRQGYRYLAAETFTDRVMDPEFKYPDYQSGFYLRDPVFAAAVRTAKRLGYQLIAYDTTERGPAGDGSFRDRTQAANLKARVFDRDPRAKVLVIAGRLHASKIRAPDGWTPMGSELKRLTGIDPFSVYAPTMSQRLTPDEENPLYRFADSRGLLKEPTIFANPAGDRWLGFDACDAYVFWPRFRVKDGRPDWMEGTLGRKRVTIPAQFLAGRGMRLVQAFVDGEPASAIPADQVVIDGPGDPKVLMLPPGRFWVRTVDRESNELAKGHLSVPG